MKETSKGTQILIALACVVTIMAMVFVAVKENLAPVIQSYVCDFSIEHGLSPHADIGMLLDNSVTITHGTTAGSCTIS